MKVFITGITGYVGGHIANSLVEKGHEVSGLVRSLDRSKTTFKTGITYEEGDLADFDLIRTKVRENDALIHAAAGNSDAWNALNDAFIEAMTVELTDTNKPFIMQGGSMVLGDTGPTQLDDSLGNITFLGPLQMKNRAMLEKKFLSGAMNKLRPIIIYGSYVYGGKGALMPHIMKETARKKGFSPFIDTGENIWSSVHIDDWAKLFTLALESNDFQGPLTASSKTYTQREIAQAIANSTNVSAKSIPSNGGLEEDIWSFFTIPISKMNQNFLSNRAFHELGWQPQKTELESFI